MILPTKHISEERCLLGVGARLLLLLERERPVNATENPVTFVPLYRRKYLRRHKGIFPLTRPSGVDVVVRNSQNSHPGNGNKPSNTNDDDVDALFD